MNLFFCKSINNFKIKLRMKNSIKVRMLRHKQPYKVKLQLLSNGKIIEMNRRKFEQRWDMGRYDVVNYEEASPSIFGSDLFEI